MFNVVPFSLTNHPTIQATVFSFQPNAHRESVEVWFTRAGVVYQFTIDVTIEEKMMTMIQSMQW